MFPCEKSSQQVDRIQGLKKQQSSCLPGKNQRTLQPQSGKDEKVGEITKPQKILRAVVIPVVRYPKRDPDRPQQLEPKWHAHGPSLYPQAARYHFRTVVTFLSVTSCQSL